jgi:hypothetical protein
LRLEGLEERYAPATVSWVGGGDGVSWGDPRNWSGGALPGPADDVVIAAAPGLTIQHTSGNDSIQSLQSQNALTISGGSLAVAAASAVNNTLTLSGALSTFTPNGDLDVVDLVHNDGTFNGTGTVTVSGQWTWTSGAEAGAGRTVLASTAQATLSGGFFSMLDGRTVDNSGSALVADQDAVTFAHAAVWNNLAGGLFVLGDGASVRNFFADAARFNNQGVVALWNSTGTSSIDVPFTNTGAVDVEAGDLRLTDGGSSAGAISLAAGTTLTVASNYTLQAGTTVTGPGTVEVLTFDTLTLAGNLNLQNLSLPGGTVTANGTLTLRNLTQAGGELNGTGTVTINGQWAWTSGRMGGTGHTVLNGSATLTGGFFSMLDGRVVDNRGTTLAFGDGFDFSNNAVWNNQPQATFVLQDTAGLGNFFAGTARFNNAGLLLKAGAGAAGIDIPVTNTGTLSVNNTSSLRIGAAYTQGAFGTLGIEVGGTTAGTDYGQLNVTGTANLDGTLVVTLVNDFTPSPGDRFQILTFGSRGNPPSNFAATILPDGLAPVFDSHSLTLVASNGTGPSVGEGWGPPVTAGARPGLGAAGEPAPGPRAVPGSSTLVQDLVFARRGRDLWASALGDDLGAA